MNQFLELPEPVFVALKEAARADGTTPAVWIESKLPKLTTDELSDEESPKTLADLFAGRIESSGTTLSENCAEQFGDYVEEKRREGRL